MDPQDTGERAGRRRLVAVIAAAALALPGGMLVSNALAADGSSGVTTAPIQETTEPIQRERERPDGRDCPEKDGAARATAARAPARPRGGDRARRRPRCRAAPRGGDR